MKLFFILFTILQLGAFAQDSCNELGKNICSRAGSYDYFSAFYDARKQAFEQSMKSSDMKDLICRNFLNKGGELVPNFAFDRECWFFWYKRTIKKLKIQSCEDFKKSGADNNFVKNCRVLVGEKLGGFVSSRASLSLKILIERAKIKMLEAYRGSYQQGQVERALDNILSHNFVYRNLHELKAEWVTPRELCEKHHEQTLCTIFRNSNKHTLSLGGFIYLPQNVLEIVITQKIAEYVASVIHGDLYSERLLVYMRYIYKTAAEGKLEGVIARANVRNMLNASTNTLLVLRQYYATFKDEEGEDLLKLRAGYFCQKPKGDENPFELYPTRQSYYTSNFQELFSYDQAEIIACPLDFSRDRSYFFGSDPLRR